MVTPLAKIEIQAATCLLHTERHHWLTRRYSGEQKARAFLEFVQRECPAECPQEWLAHEPEIEHPLHQHQRPMNEVIVSSSSIPAQTHQLKLRVAGGTWTVGTTSSARGGMSRSERRMGLQCRVIPRGKDVMWTGG